MIKLTFSKFYKGDFVDEGYELYVVKDSEAAVHVHWNLSGFGLVSMVCVESLSHGSLVQWIIARQQRTIGEVIERRLPDAWNWHIELWTQDDRIT